MKSPSNKIKQDEVKKILEGVSKLEAKEFAGSAKVSGAKSGQILVKGVDGKIQFSINYIEDKKPDMYLATTNLAGESVRVSKPAIDEIVNRKLIQDPPGDVKDEKLGTIKIESPTRVDLAGGTLDCWPLHLFVGD